MFEIPFVPPVPLIRRNHFIKKLSRANAFSAATAVTLGEAGVLIPSLFPLITKRLVRDGVLTEAGNDRYYLDRRRLS